MTVTSMTVTAEKRDIEHAAHTNCRYPAWCFSNEFYHQNKDSDSLPRWLSWSDHAGCSAHCPCGCEASEVQSSNHGLSCLLF